MSATIERRQAVSPDGGRSVTDAASTSYYGVPPIHKPHWKWEIIAYFFTGGIAGASYAIAGVADLVGGAEGRRIARIGRYLSFATLIPSPILLIMDLKRPERFYHMLRVLKLRSPMSVGTWGLVAFSGFSALSALNQAAEDGLLRRPALLRVIGQALPTRTTNAVGSGFGFFVGGYTGVLLAATAVPFWAKNAALMGPLFLASALSNATAAITGILALNDETSDDALKRLERLDTIALLAEMGLMLTFRARLGPAIGRPLEAGLLGKLHKFGVLGFGIGAPLALQAKSAIFGGKPSRGGTVLSALLVLAGGALFRYVMVHAGKASADDPQANFAYGRSASQRPDLEEPATTRRHNAAD